MYITETYDGKSVKDINYNFVFNDKYINFLHGKFDIHQICKEIIELTNSENCNITLYKNGIYTTYYTNNPSLIMCESNPLYFRSIATQKIIITKDISTDPRSKNYSCECKIKTMICIPIIYKNVVYGQILLANRPKSYRKHVISKVNTHLDMLFSMIISMEDAELYNVEKDNNQKFFASVSHEIRTPVHAIASMIGLLSTSDNLTNIQHDYINRILESCEDLVGTVSDAIDFEKIKSGNIGLVNTSFDLEELLDKIIQLLQYKVDKKGLKFVNIYNTDVPKNIYGDPKRLKQILLNLLVNAIKYTKTGSITLRTSIHGDIKRASITHGDIKRGSITNSRNNSRQSSQNYIQFCVIDTGCGISQEHIEKIFTDYYQVDINSKGMGLGLSLCKKLINMMGGDISVISTLGVGSKFSFTIPLQQDNFNIEELSDENPLKVFVVGGDDSRIQLREYFTEWNIEFDMASSYKEAKYICDNLSPFDIYILDVSNLGESLLFCKYINNKFPQSRIIGIGKQVSLKGFDKMILDTNNKSDIFNALLYTKKLHIEEPKHIKNLHVCIVEDDENSSYALCEILRKCGITSIDTFEDGESALRKINHSNYDIAFIDCKLKLEMNGIALSKLVRDKVYKIYGVSAELTDTEKKEWTKVGLEGLLIKPFNYDMICEIIKSL